MGAVTADTVLLIILVGQGVHVGLRLHGLMEGGVENDYLRDLGKDLLHSADTEDMGGVVERSVVTADSNFLHHALVYQA